MRRSVLGLVSLVLIAVMVGCAPAATTEDVYTVVSEGELAAGDDIPVPSGDVVMTVTGKIGNPNVGDAIQMDMETLESVGLVDYAMTDPFEQIPVTFRGVLMSDLLDLWGVPADATILHAVALNDYSVDIPIKDMRDYPVMLATMQNGDYMEVSDRGPLMMVYPYEHFDFDHAIYDNYWIWQLKSIEVQ